MDEIRAYCVPVGAYFGLVVPVPAGYGPGRPAGHGAVVSASGRAEGRDERRRETEGGGR